MKKFVKIFPIILFAILIQSCSKMAKETELISDYVQTIGNTKTDLKFKMQDIVLIKDITAQDSLNILKPQLEKRRTIEINAFETSIEYNKSLIKQYEDINKKETYKNLIDRNNNYIQEYKKKIEGFEDEIENFKGKCIGTSLEPLVIKIESFEKDPMAILAKEYKATYSIENPMLGNAKQTITMTFYFDPMITRIIKTE